MSYLAFSGRWDFHQFERFLQGYHGLKPGLGIIGHEHMENYHFCPQDAPNLGFDFKLPDGSLRSFSARSYRALAKMLTNDRDVMLASVGIIPSALRYASRELKGDREVVLVAVKKDPYVLEYANHILKDDDEIVLAAVRQDSYALRFVSERYRDNKEIMMAAVAENPFSLRYASDRLKDDDELVKLAVSQRIDVLRHASERIRNDPSLLCEINRDREVPTNREDSRSDLDVLIAFADRLVQGRDSGSEMVSEIER